jgi:ADP-ribose diphosphatase
MPEKPKILNTVVLAKSRLFDIEGVNLRFANGQERHFERIHGHGHGSVMIVPMLDEETVLLVREYGVGVDSYVLAFPKGAVEKNEDPLVTAAREIKEEVGYGARHFTRISQMSASPGYLRSMMDVIVATDLYPEKIDGDEPEPLEVIPWKLSEIDALLKNPEFHEARSIAALLLVERLSHDR